MATAQQIQSTPAEVAPGKARTRREQLTLYRRISWGIAITVVVALFAIVAGYQYSERDVVRDGVVVFGVDVGGMTRDQAIAAVTEATEARANRSLTIVDGVRSWEVSRYDVGLRFDVESAVNEAYGDGRSGFGPDRLALLWHFKDSPTTIDVGHVAVATSETEDILSGLATEINQPTINPVFTIADDGSYSYVAAQTGRELDDAASQQEIVRALAAGETSVNLVIAEYPPVAENVDYEPLLLQAQNALGAPITLVAANETWTFTPGQIASRLEIIPPTESEAARLALDEDWSIRLIDEIGWSVDRRAQSPRVWWDGNGQLVVVRDPQPGYQINAGEALETARNVLSGFVDMDTVTLPRRNTASAATTGGSELAWTQRGYRRIEHTIWRLD